VALQAQQLTALLGERGELHFTAGLLSRVGEMVAIRIIQQHLESGETLTDEEITAAITGWAQRLGNQVKIQWRLSLALRELVGAIYVLPSGTVSRDRIVMRAAALMAADEGSSEGCRRLLRRLGIHELESEQNNGKG